MALALLAALAEARRQMNHNRRALERVESEISAMLDEVLARFAQEVYDGEAVSLPTFAVIRAQRVQGSRLLGEGRFGTVYQVCRMSKVWPQETKNGEKKKCSSGWRSRLFL